MSICKHALEFSMKQEVAGVVSVKITYPTVIALSIRVIPSTGLNEEKLTSFGCLIASFGFNFAPFALGLKFEAFTRSL